MVPKCFGRDDFDNIRLEFFDFRSRRSSDRLAALDGLRDTFSPLLLVQSIRKTALVKWYTLTKFARKQLGKDRHECPMQVGIPLKTTIGTLQMA
jgi:hypothetical protein